MPASNADLFKLVGSAKLIPPANLQEAYKTAAHLNLPLADVIIGRKLIPQDQLGALVAQSYSVGFINLKKLQIPKDTLNLINEQLALERKIVPFALSGQVLSLAMQDPRDLDTINFVSKVTGLQVAPFFAFPSDVKFSLRQYKGTLAEDFQKLLDQVAAQRLGTVSPQELAEDVSIVEAVDKMLEYAVVEDASDVHVEPLADKVLIRYRIDGVLHDAILLPKELHPAVIARLKILSTLKLDETRLPQDGRLKFESDEGEIISLRISILPTVEGEKAVLRLLEGGTPELSLEELGFDQNSTLTIRHALARPHGLILITGPTGSGKTTSLYTMLSLLNTDSVNISTVEDPVENRIRRINQTQVNPRIKLGFAEGLRALLRQDPDIIMVGEIRDKETAQMAVNASMTGHLVLSTLHTNDAPGAIPRLLDLGAEPFLVASTLELVIAQRLVRRLCNYCQVTKTIDPKLADYFTRLTKQSPPTTVRLGTGCDHCNYTGYSGRTGVYELFAVDDRVRELVINKPTASQIREVVIKNGMRTMLVDGLTKVSKGLTTLEEVLRVTSE